MSNDMDFNFSCPPLRNANEVIRLGHGSGGKLSKQILEEIFLPAFDNEILNQCQDAAVLPFDDKDIVVTTDSYVVSPIFFPGGNIGSLSVHGTINDLSMRGAKPLYMSVAFVLEEGFSLLQLKEIVYSMNLAAKQNDVQIIAGDTKVVNRGACDKIFITTTGIGKLYSQANCGVEKAKEGDAIIASGDLGRHGITIMCARNDFELESKLESDSASLSAVVKSLFQSNLEIHCLRDVTRGGLATCLNEIALSSKLSIEVDESLIPLCSQVEGACEILGLDPLFAACEGRFICIVPEKDSSNTLEILHTFEICKEARIIGKMTKKKNVPVSLKTKIGSKRALDMLSGEQLPRIC